MKHVKFYLLSIFLLCPLAVGCGVSKPGSPEIVAYTTSRESTGAVWIIQYAQHQDGRVLYLVFTKYNKNYHNAKSGPVHTTSNSDGKLSSTLMLSDRAPQTIYPTETDSCQIFVIEGLSVLKMSADIDADTLQLLLDSEFHESSVQEFVDKAKGMEKLSD